MGFRSAQSRDSRVPTHPCGKFSAACQRRAHDVSACTKLSCPRFSFWEGSANIKPTKTDQAISEAMSNEPQALPAKFGGLSFATCSTNTQIPTIGKLYGSQACKFARFMLIDIFSLRTLPGVLHHQKYMTILLIGLWPRSPRSQQI